MTQPSASQESQESQRKIIRVVGAAIVSNGTILCARRGSGKQLAGMWEFPGGKIEAGETPQDALHREIEEELECEVRVGKEVTTSEAHYSFGTVILTTFVCHLISGTPHLTEHEEIAWLEPGQMPTPDLWAPADREAVAIITSANFALE